MTFPEVWKGGRNYVNISDGDVCALFIRHSDGTLTECKCHDEDGFYRFAVDVIGGEEIVVASFGDVNLNGEANGEDLALFAQYIRGQYKFAKDSATQYSVGDINRNGEANGEDLALFAQSMRGQYELKWNLTDEPFDTEDPGEQEPPEPENEAPVITGFDLTVSDDSQSGGYVEDVQHHLFADIAATDAEDGEDVRIFAQVDDDPWFEVHAGSNALGYVQSGEHTVRVYAQDQDGAQSEIMTKTVTVERVSTMPKLVAKSVETETGRGFKAEIQVNGNAADSSVFEVWSTTWTLTDADTGNIVMTGFTKDGQVAIGDGVIVSGTASKYGLDIALTGVGGQYVLSAVSQDQYGNKIWAGEVILDTENMAPDVQSFGLEYTVDRTNVTDVYTTDAKAWVSFQFEDWESDPDGDSVTLYDARTGEPLEDGYYPVGTTTFDVYLVDEWGLASETVPYSVIVANTAPETPVILVDRQTGNTKQVDGKLLMYVETSVEAADQEDDLLKLVYESEVPSDFYGTGDYFIKVKAVDIFGAESDWAEQAFEVSDVQNPIDPDGGFDVDTTFDFVVNDEHEITIHVGTPVTMAVVSGKYDIRQVEYRQFLNENMSIAQETVKFDENAVAAGEGLTLDWTPVAAGDYTYEVSVLANDKSIITGDMTRLTDTVVIHVVNDAPSAPVVSAAVDYNNVFVDEDGTMKYFVELTADSTDPDGDEVTIVWDGASYVSGYYAPGTYAVKGVYAVDEWGAKSDVNATYRFTVAGDGSPTINSGDISVHQGDNFVISVLGGKFDVQALVFQYNDKELVQTGSPVLAANGGYDQTLSISEAAGQYQVTVTARVQTGEGTTEMAVGSVRVLVYNDAPEVEAAELTTGAFVGGKMSLSLQYTVTEPENDTVTVYARLDDGEAVELGSALTGAAEFEAAFGEHSVEVWAVDQWGKESKHVTKSTHLGSYFTDNYRKPDMAYTVTDLFENGYTTDAKVWVDFSTTWNETLDMSQVQEIIYKVNGERVDDLSGYYSLGEYVVEAYGIDLLGIESAHGTVTMTLTNVAPDMGIISIQSDRTDYVNAYTDEAAYKFTFNTAFKDKDTPDMVKFFMSTDGGEFVEGNGTGHYSIGSHSVDVKAVDIWGASSKAFTRQVNATNNAPVITDARFADITEADVTNPYTDDARAVMTSIVAGKDSDSDEYQFEYQVNGEAVATLDGLYAAGDYVITVVVRDVFNGTTEQTFDLSLGGESDTVVTLSHEMLGTWESPYLPEAKEHATITIGASSESGAGAKLYMSVDGGEPVELDALDSQTVNAQFGLGEHSVTVYSLNVWGKWSEAATDAFELKSDVPSGKLTTTLLSTYNKAYTDECTRNVRLNAEVINDEGEPFQAAIQPMSGETQYFTSAKRTVRDAYALGENVAILLVVDVWGQTSEEIISTTNLTTADPSVRILVGAFGEYQNAYTENAIREADLTVYTDNDTGESVQVVVNVGANDAQIFTGATVELSDYFGVGSTPVSVVVTDVWGRTGTATTDVVMTNNAPVLDGVSAKLDMSVVQNPYTTDAKAQLVVTAGEVTDEQQGGNAPQVYYRLDGEDVTPGSGIYVGKGTHTVEAYAIDVWGVRSEVYTRTVSATGSKPVVSITSPTFPDAGNPVTNGSNASFNIKVTGSNQYQLKWLDYYSTNKKVTTLGTGLTSGTVSQVTNGWFNGQHVLVVQAMDIFGEAVYGSFYFMTGMASGAGGSVNITGSTALATTEPIVVNGKPLAVINSFTVKVPTISGHNSGNADWLRVTGVDAAGRETKLVEFNTNDGACTVSAKNGSGTYAGSQDSGSFTYDPAKYVKLKLEFYSPHESCMQNGGASMSYTLNYTFLENDDSLSGLDALFK